MNGSSLSQIRSWAAQRQGVNPSVLASNQTLPYIANSLDYNQYNNIDDAARKLQILTMQNRILKAQQQSVMIKKQIDAVTVQQRNRIQAQQITNTNYRDDQRQFTGQSQPRQPELHQQPIMTNSRISPSQTPSNNNRIPSLNQEVRPPSVAKTPEHDDNNSNSNAISPSAFQSTLPPSSSPPLVQPQPLEQDTIISPRKPKLLPPTHRKKLGDLSSDLSSVVEENTNAIAKEKTQLLSNADRTKLKNRDERKRVVDSIAMQSTSRAVKIMPRWRHRLLGNHNPPPETIMKPKSLFRAVAFGLITAIIAPERAMNLAKYQRKEKETRDFARSLRIFLESFSDWLCKPVALPITSIVEDGSLDFDVKDWITNHNKFIPFKVRFKAITQGLSTAAMPSITITNFLVSFLSDENYFPDDFFWPNEQPLMQYNRLGGTRDVIPICETEEEVLALPGMTQKDVKRIVVLEEDGKDGVRWAGVLRLRMILIDVLFVRIVIAKLILSPWHHKVCRQPVNRNVRRAVSNLRLMATILYRLARKLNPLLPVPQPPTIVNNNRAAAVDTITPGKAAAGTIASGNNSSVTKLPAISMKNNASETTNTEEAKEETKDEENKAKAPPKAPKGVVASLLKVVGLADTTPGFEDFKKGTLEFQLLNEPARYYDDTDFLFRFLLPDTTFVAPNLHTMLEDLLEESLPLLREWFDKLMTHILHAVIAKRTKQQQVQKPLETSSPRLAGGATAFPF